MKSGGIAKVRFFTRIFLAAFGLFPWNSVPQLLPELILMPQLSHINVYTLSSWTRVTLIPLLLVRHHQPIYALPNGTSTDNDYFDELWCDPKNKNIPYSESFWDLLWKKEMTAIAFTALDSIVYYLGGLRYFPLRSYARQQCVK